MSIIGGSPVFYYYYFYIISYYNYLIAFAQAGLIARIFLMGGYNKQPRTRRMLSLYMSKTSGNYGDLQYQITFHQCLNFLPGSYVLQMQRFLGMTHVSLIVHTLS